ncbi:DUF1572 domain-containing protein [Lacihabitans sp. CCS-44]|uniref:DUF1572 domain-containing protein n=1 Tax=Lacihabitans sp. CCS-44 TaxID=2487331 RepID=UPI0020CC7C65|nr:DUF1572 domain-containing protein [Lacihabitans sp. CCS-44]MCP9756141.1 DUF1572 domain-containing protein [Lacihabitans sp. CCS-44]
MKIDFLDSVKKQFEYYKLLGEKTFDQIADDQINWQYNAESNSIAIIVKHLSGNMLSRWTDFLTTDGEKEWRNRDAEFEGEIKTKIELFEAWNKGWSGLFEALDSISNEDLDKVIYIRNQGHTVMEAINRQLAHYPYHVGQIVFIGKMLLDENWQTLSIAKRASSAYNAEKFSKEKNKGHFTDEYLGKRIKQSP